MSKVQEKVYTIRLRKILLYDFLYYFIFLISILYVVISINIEYKYVDYSDKNILEGTIVDMYKTSDKLVLDILSNDKIQCTYYYDEKFDLELFLGDHVKLPGTYQIPSENTNFNLFNYRNYLKSKNVFYLFNVSSIEKTESNTNIFFEIKNFIINKINNNY